jgi:DNA-binding LytR/AlgR family response regulator
MKLTCVIIDDEYLARQYIRDYIERLPFLELAGDYNSPLLIMDELKRNAIDILFLDIQMPDITGIDFLKILNPQPYIILTTAYKEYALEGYEHNVIDYLLKPFSFDRFLKAINKVVDRAEKEGTGRTFMTIRADRKLYKINYDDLIYIEGQRAYVTFHTTQRKITALISMKELEEKLPGDQFIRIHKCFIVSIKYLESLQGNMIEICGRKLAVGSSYRDQIEKILKFR